MNFHKKILVSTAGLSLLILVPNITLANSIYSPRPRVEARKEIKEARCTIAEGRIHFRINKFNTLKDDHIKNYDNIKNSLKELADKLDAKGFDTTKIRADYQTLNDKIVKRATDYATFITKLEATKGFACGESEGQFVSALKDARAQLLTVREDTVDIRNFYATVIRPDIKALRTQKSSPSPTTN